MHQKYPLLLTEGCASLSRPPVFYGTDHSTLFQESSTEQWHAVWDLLVEQSSFRNIPGRIVEHDSATGTMPTICLDVDILEQEIERDKAKGRLPCAVFASHMDDLEALRALCDRYDLWLHVEGGSSSMLNCAALGSATAAVGAAHTPSSTSTAQRAHEPEEEPTANAATPPSNSTQDATQTASVTSSSTSALSEAPADGSIPRGDEASSADATSPPPPPPPRRRNYAHLSTVRRLLACANSVSAQPHDWWKYEVPERSFNSIIPTTLTFLRSSPADAARWLPPAQTVSSTDFAMHFALWLQLRMQNFGELRAHVEHALIMCDRLLNELRLQEGFFKVAIGPDPDALPHILLFQIVPNTDRLDVDQLNLDVNAFHNEYLLPQLNRDAVRELCLTNSVYQQKSCFLFQPLKVESSHTVLGAPHTVLGAPHTVLGAPHIARFIDSVVPLITLAELAIQMWPLFEQALLDAKDLAPLLYTQVRGFVGVGAFRFVPDVVRGNADAVGVLNRDLLNALVEKDPLMYRAASTTDTNELCIAVTVSRRLSSPTFLKDLVAEIALAAEQLQFPEEVIDSLASHVRKGIESAETRLSELSTDEYGPDSLLRKIPLFGSMYGWAFPEDESSKQKMGQAFDLRSNSVTAPTFMQLKKTPATPGKPPQSTTTGDIDSSSRKNVRSPEAGNQKRDATVEVATTDGVPTTTTVAEAGQGMNGVEYVEEEEAAA